MKIKLFLYSVCFICSLTGIQQVSADGHDERDIGGTIKLFLSGGSLSPSLQTIDYEDKDADDPTTSGGGIVLDINLGRGNHAIALDYYTFTETYSSSQLEAEFGFAIDAKEEFDALLLGYRYHFNSGFYIGGGILNLNNPTFTATSDINGLGRFEYIIKQKSARPLALTLGYDHVFDSGFTIGAHLLRSASIDAKPDSSSATLILDGIGDLSDFIDTSGVDLEDIVIQSVGLGIGYSW